MEAFSTMLGIIGVAMILVAYAGLQLSRMRNTGLPYLWLNLVGAVFILFSLFFHWNLPSFIIEICWILITLYGFRQRRQRGPAETAK